MAAGSSNKSGTDQEGSWKEDKPRKKKKEAKCTMPQFRATNLTGRRLGDARVATPAVQANGTLCATTRPECRTGNFLRTGESKTTANTEFEPTDQWERSTSAYHK